MKKQIIAVFTLLCMLTFITSCGVAKTSPDVSGSENDSSKSQEDVTNPKDNGEKSGTNEEKSGTNEEKSGTNGEKSGTNGEKSGTNDDIEVTTYDEQLTKKLSKEDAKTISNILTNGKWQKDSTKLSADCKLKLSKDTIDYSLSGGKFSNYKKNESLSIDNKTKENVDNILKKYLELDQKVIEQYIIKEADIEVISYDEKITKKLSKEDAKIVADILTNGKWQRGITKSISDCKLKISEDTIGFSSAGSILNIFSKDKHLKIDNKTKEKIESILKKYVELGK